jgi:hypothetical protein
MLLLTHMRTLPAYLIVGPVPLQEGGQGQLLPHGHSVQGAHARARVYRELDHHRPWIIYSKPTTPSTVRLTKHRFTHRHDVGAGAGKDTGTGTGVWGTVTRDLSVCHSFTYSLSLSHTHTHTH